MRVHLIRHGQSVWNAQRLLQGQTMHIGLTERGFEQARELANELADQPIGLLISSDQRRAVQTAELLGARLGLLPVLDARLREQSRGEYEGRPTDAVLARTAEVDWTDPDLRVGEGESTTDVYRRLTALFAELVSPPATAPAERSEIALVSHGDTIRIACGVLEGRLPADIDYRSVPNGAVLTITVPASVSFPLGIKPE